jgi:hypothetical protein
MSFALGASSLGLSQEEKPLQEAQVKVLIGSVINKNPGVVQEFLQSLQCLKKENFACDYYFIVEQSSEIVRQHIPTLEGEGQSHKSSCMVIDPSKERPLGYSYIWLLGAYRDRMIEYARMKNYDYLFLIDDDLVLHPETLRQLVGEEKEIISNIIWTDWGTGPVPQVWLSDNGNPFDFGIEQTTTDEEKKRKTTQFFELLKIAGTYEIGGLGACTLISRKALGKPINFQRIRNLSWISENVHFCLRATALGIPLFVNTQYPTYHIIRDTGACSLADVAEFKKRVGIPS